MAMNFVRTESNRYIVSGMMDCAARIQDGVEGSNMVYTATWRTMKDERVRPQKRYKTKSGWKTAKRNGKEADHQKMEGVTIQVGDKFDLGEGIYTKCPGMSGYAKHDCRCRCKLSYKLMTREKFDTLPQKQINFLK